MRLLLLLLSCLSLHSGWAQRVIDVTKQDSPVGANTFYSVGGEPFVNAKFVNLVEGTPYFKDQWLNTVLIGENNQEFKDVSAKLDLVDNQVHYLDKDGKEFTATTKIKQVVFTDALGNNYKFVHSSSLPKTVNPFKEGWYLWLVSGNASLYKYFTKNLSEVKPYGSATVEQRIRTKETYLVLYNNSLLEIKKLKDAPSVLANKKKEVEDYLKSKDNPKESMDDRFTSLIEHYNNFFSDQK